MSVSWGWMPTSVLVAPVLEIGNSFLPGNLHFLSLIYPSSDTEEADVLTLIANPETWEKNNFEN